VTRKRRGGLIGTPGESAPRWERPFGRGAPSPKNRLGQAGLLSFYLAGYKYSPHPCRILRRREVLRFAQDFASLSDAQIVKERRDPVQLARTSTFAGFNCIRWLQLQPAHPV